MSYYQEVMAQMVNRHAELKAELDGLEQAIKAVQSLLIFEQRGIHKAPASGQSFADVYNANPVTGPILPLPCKPFANKTILDATIAYLRDVHTSKSTRQIADALQAGGIKSHAQNFYRNVYNTLNHVLKRKTSPVIYYEDNTWGLSEWQDEGPQSETEVHHA